jgi:hypothetical protein
MSIASPYSSSSFGSDATATSPPNRSLLRRFADFVAEGRQRKAEAALAQYLRSHESCLSPQVKAELERRLSGQ